jgi:arginyl-tRNA synthetase
MIRQTIRHAFQQAVATAYPGVAMPVGWLKLERPKIAEHGDYAVNVSGLAKVLRQPPPLIAKTVAGHLNTEHWTVDVVGGFVNLRLSAGFMAASLANAFTADAAVGQNTRMQGQCLSLEFVSANPTGPLHIGHGRWAALGDSLRRILTHCGAEVRAEFYINDAGVQMNNLARSLWWRCQELLQPATVMFPAKPRNPDEPYPYYPGEYLKALAQQFLTEHAQAFDGQPIEPNEASDLFDQLKQFGRQQLLHNQQVTLTTMQVSFDRWISETALYDTGAVATALNTVVASGHTYEQDGALWLNTQHFGDEKDRVLRKQDGTYTYLTPDIACHWDKWHHKPTVQSPAVTQMINIWGADHHGYIVRMQACMQVLQLPPSALHIVLGQLVNLIVDGEKTRMGKRRTMLTLQDLVDEVGVDATRFWMVSKSADTALDFDVDLATSQTSENPVFYAQYAHARCSGIVRTIMEPMPDRDTDEVKPALSSPAQWAAFKQQVQTNPSVLLQAWHGIEPNSLAEAAIKALVIKLDSFTDCVEDAARLLTPHLIARYVLELAAEFHHFYAHCRVITDDLTVTHSRLALIAQLQRTLAQALSLLGVSAPERM